MLYNSAVREVYSISTDLIVHKDITARKDFLIVHKEEDIGTYVCANKPSDALISYENGSDEAEIILIWENTNGNKPRIGEHAVDLRGESPFNPTENEKRNKFTKESV